MVNGGFARIIPTGHGKGHALATVEALARHDEPRDGGLPLERAGFLYRHWKR
jgi:hypothetical protein